MREEQRGANGSSGCAKNKYYVCETLRNIDRYKGAVNIYGKTGPGNEQWRVVNFTMALLILPYNIVYGPISAWSKILYGPV